MDSARKRRGRILPGIFITCSILLWCCMKLSITMMRVRTSEYNGNLGERIRMDYYKALCKGIVRVYSAEGTYNLKTEEELKINGAKKLAFNSEKDVLMGEYEGLYRFYILFSEKKRECSVVVRKK